LSIDNDSLTEIRKNIDLLDKGLRYLAKQNKAYEESIISLDVRLKKIENAKSINKGDDIIPLIRNKTKNNKSKAPIIEEPLPIMEDEESPTVKFKIKKLPLPSIERKENKNRQEKEKDSDDDCESSSEEEDEMSLVVSLAKKKANEKLGNLQF
jgi:hypothetical protein